MKTSRKKIPSVSVVMPLYNNAEEVSRAIRAVLGQTYSDFELIVVDDGSADGSERIVRRLKDKRIRVIHQAHSGVSPARNKGIEEARADLIAFCDADDEWQPLFLETIVSLRSTFPYSDVFGTGYLYREQTGGIRTPILQGIEQPWRGVIQNYFALASKSDPPLWSSAVAVTKKALLSVGNFPVGVTIGEDILTWARLALRYRIAYASTPLSTFWLRGPIAGKPTRSPEEPDRVGQFFMELLPHVPSGEVRDFKRYVALWHRMRTAMYLQLRQRKSALKELRMLSRYSLSNSQFYIYLFLALLPYWLQEKAFKSFSYFKIRRRRTVP